MAKIEVDETSYLEMQQTYAAVNKMLSNPQARRKVLEATKVINPAAIIPEIDAAAPISAELTETRTQIAALQKRLDDDAAERASTSKVNEFASQWNGAKAQLQRERGYTAEGIAEIEKLAQERGIPDLEAAAALFDRLHPPPEPVQPAGIGSFNFFEPTEKDGEDMKKLLESRGESEQVVMKMAREALNDFRSGRR